MKYRPEIDGLRAIAVVPVMLFHAGFSMFSGGFVGVDVFFVISGYLITSILLKDLDRGTFSFTNFYMRRAKRILPALFAVMLSCLPFAWLWMLPNQLKDFCQSLVSTTLFSSNILFWLESGYFDAAAEEKPLLHTWSLAVEEQYYIVFPLLLFFIFKYRKSYLVPTLAILGISSFVASEIGWRHEPSANFYLGLSRAWEILAGAFCALHLYKNEVKPNNLLSGSGLLLILISVFAFDGETPFPSVYTLLPVLGTVFIVLFSNTESVIGKVLSLRPFVGVGLISYSLYLWHQPLLAFAKIREAKHPSVSLVFVLIGVSFLLSYISWRWIEQPYRKDLFSISNTKRKFVLLASIASFLIVGIGASGHLNSGFPSRPILSTTMRDLGKRLRVNFGLHMECEGNLEPLETCSTSTNPEVLLWGDSFAMHLAEGILASRPGLGLRQYTMSSCAPVFDLAFTRSDLPVSWAKECLAFNENVFRWLKANESVKTVVLSSMFNGILDASLYPEHPVSVREEQIQIVGNQLLKTVAAIQETGRRVVLVSPMPTNSLDIGRCLVRSQIYNFGENYCDFEIDMKLNANAWNLMGQLKGKLPIYWLHKDFCSENKCDALQDGVFIYRDTDHLSYQGSEYLGKKNQWMDKFEAL